MGYFALTIFFSFMTSFLVDTFVRKSLCPSSIISSGWNLRKMTSSNGINFCHFYQVMKHLLLWKNFIYTQEGIVYWTPLYPASTITGILTILFYQSLLIFFSFGKI